MELNLGEKLNGSKSGLSYSINVIFYLFLSLLASIIILASGMGTNSDGANYISFLVSPIAICITIAIIFKLGKLNFKEVYPVKCKPKYYLIALMLIFGLLFSLSEVNEYFLEFLKLLGYTPKLTDSSIPSTDGWLVLPVLIVIAVLPAITEEALFRGVILGGVENDVGSIGSIFIVGFLFSLFHGSAEQTIYQFVCGCVFALLVVRARSILPAILMHFINNALIIILSACNALDSAGNLAISDGANIAITVLSAVCFVVGLVMLILDKTPLKKGVKGGAKKVFIFASVGIFIMAIIWILGLFNL
jgi:membrane protease YdiL (CAAX protease family)